MRRKAKKREREREREKRTLRKLSSGLTMTASMSLPGAYSQPNTYIHTDVRTQGEKNVLKRQKRSLILAHEFIILFARLRINLHESNVVKERLGNVEQDR